MKISPNGRYFTDDEGRPIFWLGDTQWQLLRSFSLEDSRYTLANRKAHGFSFIQIMLLGVDIEPNVDGELPMEENDPARPNEAYFRHIDEIVRHASKLGDIHLVIGVYHKRYPEGRFTPRSVRAWARWIASRYRDVPCIAWSMYPAAKPEYVPVCRELAAGLREGDGGSHLITVHPDPSPATSAPLFHHEPWLAFNSIQTFKQVDLIYPMTGEDCRRTPAKPAVMAEGAYESGIEYGFEVTPIWVRRQAYYSYFAGGHHSYGHNDSWRLNPTWREALDAPGAAQMGVLRRALESLPEWWQLTPDNTLFAEGGRTEGDLLTVAARHAEGRWIAVYAAEPDGFTLDLRRFDGKAYDSAWIDPASGAAVDRKRVAAGPGLRFAVPPGLQDGLLLLQGV